MVQGVAGYDKDFDYRAYPSVELLVDQRQQ